MNARIDDKIEIWTLDLAKRENAERVKRLASGVSGGYFGPLGKAGTYNSNEQRITGAIDISGFPAGTTMVSVWVTEDAGGTSHAGDAAFFTAGVQMHSGGTKCRVYFGVRYKIATQLPFGISVMCA